MVDVKEIVSQMTVTVSEQAADKFHQSNVDLRQFLEGRLSGSVSCTVDRVGRSYQITSSYGGIKHIRLELIKQLEKMSSADEPQLQPGLLQNKTDNDRQESTQEIHDDAGGHDAKPSPLPSHKSLQSDVIDNQSQSTESKLSREVTKQESLQKPKRTRKLKSQQSGGDNPTEAKEQTDLLADDGNKHLLDEETRKLIENGERVSIEVDKDRHHYLMMHFGDDLKKQLPPSFPFIEADGGKHKVVLAVDSKKGDINKESIIAKYNSYLDCFQFDIVIVPNGFDKSVLSSLVATADIRNLSFVLNEDNNGYKLIGRKEDVDKMKRLIGENTMAANEQLQQVKEPEDDWKCKNTKKKREKKRASNFSFSIQNGKLIHCESSQSLATKNCLLQVTLFEWKQKTPPTEVVVCAIDGQMHGFGETSTAIQFDGGKKYKDECRKILHQRHNRISVGSVVDIQATGDLLQKLKVKYIVHIVLEEKVKAASVVDKVTVIKDAVYNCLHYADSTLNSKSIAFPHLGGSDYCDIGSFVHGSIRALQALTNHHLQRVSFVAKDSKTLEELTREFESCVDFQSGSQSTPSSDSSYPNQLTSF